ncbi:hypothetical protein ACFWH4_33940 [Streptomyces sp. NPDC127091]|uniref:hypothetical protein n=1 Tax=Streptomyces sp. NPDC127091 TaxID=3347134 RepID=UPI0036650A12
MVRLFAVRPLEGEIWLVGAAILHDLILLPLYSPADLSALSVLRHRATDAPTAPWINYLCVPAFLSSLLLLVWFPLILRLAVPYPGDTGLSDGGYLGRWPAITGVLFAASAPAFALRLRHAPPLRPLREPVYLRLTDGRRIRMPVHRRHARPTAADKTVLERCVGPVLDVGCGPGRLCRELLSQGVFALRGDIAPRAVTLTSVLGGLALCRSVFDRLPAERGWQTLLLIDGDIGIGGYPRSLLHRCRDLIAPTGRLVIEVDPDDVEELCTVRFENLQGRSGPPLPWAQPRQADAVDDIGWTVSVDYIAVPDTSALQLARKQRAQPAPKGGQLLDHGEEALGAPGGNEASCAPSYT